MARIVKYTLSGNKIAWRVKYIAGIDSETGKYIDKTKSGFKTEREAKLFAHSVELKKGRTSTIINDKKIIFSEFIDRWLVAYADSGIKTSTLVNRKSTSIPHIKKHLGKCYLSEINGTIISSMLSKMEAHGYSKGTTDTVYITIRLILKYALEEGFIREIPNIKRKRKKRTLDDYLNEQVKDEFLEKDELKNLLKIIKKKSENPNNMGDYAIFLTLAYTGMRIGELLSLKWTDIDFNNRRINVCKTIFRENNKIDQFELTLPKTNASIRQIPMSENVINVLFDLHDKQKELRKHKMLAIDEDFVFIKMSGNYCGYPELSRSILYKLKTNMAEARIPKKITIHKFRHTFTSLMAEAGVDLYTIQEILGHENSKLTQKIYLHITNSKKDDAISKYDNLLRD